MDPQMMQMIQMMLQSNPNALGSVMQGAYSNPEGFAAMMDGMGAPTPDRGMFETMMNPMSGLGAELAGGPVPGGVPGPGVAGGPPPVMPEVPYDASAMADPRQLTGTADILSMMQPQGAPGGAPPGGNPAAAMQQRQQPLGRIPIAPADKKQFSGGVSGAQKVPDVTQAKGPSPMLAVLQQIMGGKGGAQQRGQLPGLGALLSGGQ